MKTQRFFKNDKFHDKLIFFPVMASLANQRRLDLDFLLDLGDLDRLLELEEDELERRDLLLLSRRELRFFLSLRERDLDLDLEEDLDRLLLDDLLPPLFFLRSLDLDPDEDDDDEDEDDEEEELRRLRP